MPRARSRSSAIAEPASARAARTSSATSGRSASFSSARPSFMRQRDEPRLRAVVQVALDPAQLRRLHVERSAARARQLVHALDELLLARAGAEPAERDEDRVHGEQDA